MQRLFLFILLCIVVGVPAHARAQLRPVSRNSLVFVTSTVESEEWQAYRIVRPEEPAVFRVEGPGRVLIKLRAIVEGEDDVESIAAVLEGERAVLTARVDPSTDGDATIVDDPKGRRPSNVRLFLLRVDAGTHRITIRHSEGADLLVTARYAPPLVEWDPSDDDAVPLASPNTEPSTAVQNVGALEDGDDGFDAEPAPPVATDDQRVRRGDPALEEPEDPGIDTRAAAATVTARPLTVEAPYFQFEIHGGVLFSGFLPAPAPIVGVDVRVAPPGLDAARWSIGAAIDLTHANGDAIVHASPGGPAVDIVEVTQTALFLGLDLRYVWLRLPRRLDLYGSVGASGLIGSIATESATTRANAPLWGGLGSFRVGGTLGDRGSRPFAELRVLAGVVASDITRRDGGTTGDPAGYAAVSIVVGYRVELLSEVLADVGE